MRSTAVRAVVLLAALGVACGPGAPATPVPRATWTTLVSPLAPGREVTRGFVLAVPTRGHEHDVVFRATRGADGDRVEVHVVDRARWPDARLTGAFGVAWEVPRTTASRDDAEAVTEALTRALATHPGVRGPVDAIPLDGGGSGASTARPRALGLLALLGTWRTLPWWLVALALVVGALRGRVRFHRLDAALFAAALFARVTLGAWRPFHVNGQGPLWIHGALHPEELRAYGPGWSEVHGWLPRLVALDTAVFSTHVALGAALAPLAAIVARRVGLSPGHALVAGALLAADPVLIRIGATESYVVPVLALAAASAATLLEARGVADDRRRAAALLLAGALLAAQCARIHPIGWMAIAVVPLIVAAGAGLRAGLYAALAIGGATALTSGCVLADVLSSVAHGAVARPTWLTRPAWIWLALLAAAAAHPRARRLAPAAVFAGVLGSIIAETYGQSAIWRLAAVHAVCLPWALAGAALLPDAVTTTARAGALSAALAIAALAAGLPMIRARTTDEMEFAWARDWMASRPASCRVAWVVFAGPRRTVFLPQWAHRGAAVRIDARESVNVRALLDPLGCTEYVRTTACDAPDASAACADIERALVLAPTATMSTFPARASHRGLPYATATVRAQVFRVTGFSD